MPTIRRWWSTLVLVLFCLGGGLPVVVALTPGQELDAFGQHIAVGARPPDLSVAGPARLVQVGNTTFDVDRLQVWGPLRPQLTLGPVQRNADSQAPTSSPRASSITAWPRSTACTATCSSTSTTCRASRR